MMDPSDHRECPCRRVRSSHHEIPLPRTGQDAAAAAAAASSSPRKSSSSLPSSVLLCPVCVSALLQKSLHERDLILEQRNEAREECARGLSELSKRGPDLSELQYESQRLRSRLAKLRQQCGSLAVQVASQVVENDERRAQQQQQDTTHVLREHLSRLTDSLCDPDGGALLRGLESGTEQVKRLRFRWAMRVFAMYRLDVDQEENRPSTRHRHARGIGKIGGLPLPHAGPELYGVLPPQELQSALRLVASLMSTVARCLGIVLPHPILLQPNGPRGDITDTVSQHEIAHSSLPAAAAAAAACNTSKNNHSNNQTGEKASSPSTNNTTTTITSSTTSLSSIMDATSALGRSAKKALKRATGSQQQSQQQQKQAFTEDAAYIASTCSIPPSMDAAAVARRLRHATSAILAEDHATSSSSSGSSSLYALSHSPHDIHDESFAVGLQLLQNNAVALCIRAGVPVSQLWPGEAILLNLNALWVFCQEQVEGI